MNIKAYLLLSAFMGAMCKSEPPPPSPTKDHEPEGDYTCATACANLIGCEEGTPTPGEDGIPGTNDDQTCEMVCRNVQNSGTIDYPVECLSKIKAGDCEAAKECN